MKRTSIFLFLFSISISLSWAEIVPLTILSTNDLHGHLIPNKADQGGAARIAAYFKKVRSEEKHVLILNAGDMISGTAVSSVFSGDPIYHVTNHWGIDAACLGNHEFDYGWQRIERFSGIANFPLLCANAFVKNAKGQHEILGDAEYIIIQKGALKIGVIGIVSEDTPFDTSKMATDGVHFSGEIETLNHLIPKVSEQCDMLIALTHVGKYNDLEISKMTKGINLIVGGHSHTRFSRMTKNKDKFIGILQFNPRDNTTGNRKYLKQVGLELAEYNDTTIFSAKYISEVPITQAGAYGLFIGRTDLTFDTQKDQIQNFSYQLIPVNQELTAPDPQTLKEIRKWEEQVEDMLDKPLGVAQSDFNKTAMLCLAEEAFMQSTSADYAHQNSGGTRALLKKGEFNYREVWNIFPFENTLVVAQCKGSEIPGNFYGHNPIEPDKTYKIVTNSYVKDQMEKQSQHTSIKWQDTGITLRDSVLKYIEKRKTIKPFLLTK
jgi:5'-nucleotidase / UDP-sugar diphosphatase